MHRARETRAYSMENMPPKTSYEIALIGRSNVGKSSLLNAILNYKVAHVSQKPGCTLWVGIHQFHDATLIDLPGYGYAKTSKNRRGIVNDLVHDYFELRRTDMLLLLIDMRRGLMDIDNSIIEQLSHYAIPIRLIGTKADKKGANSKEIDMVSSVKDRIGVRELRDYIISISSPNQNQDFACTL